MGKAGNVVVPLCAPCKSPLKGTGDAHRRRCSRTSKTHKLYVNVHTAKNPNGEIRGQLATGYVASARVLVVAATERELGHVRRFDTLLLRDRPGRGGGADGAARSAERRPDGGASHRDRRALEQSSPCRSSSDRKRCTKTRSGRSSSRASRPMPSCSRGCAATLPEAHVLPIGTSAHVGGTRECEVEAMEGFACAARVPARGRACSRTARRSRMRSPSPIGRSGASTRRSSCSERC